MGDPLEKYRQRYKELQQQKNTVTKEPKTAIKTETVDNTDVPNTEYQIDYPTMKYSEYNTPNLSWLSEDAKQRVLQTPTIENVQESTKREPERTSRGDVEQYKRTLAENEQEWDAKAKKFVEATEKSKDLNIPKIPKNLEYFEDNIVFGKLKEEDASFTQGMNDMPVDSESKKLIEQQWKDYKNGVVADVIQNTETDLDGWGYVDAVAKGLRNSIGKTVTLGGLNMPVEWKQKMSEDYSKMSETQKFVGELAETVGDVYIGLTGSSTVVTPLMSKIPIKSLVGMRILNSTATLELPTILGGIGDLRQDRTNVNKVLEDTFHTAVLGSTIGANPFKNVALRSLYDVIVPTTASQMLQQGGQVAFDGAPVDWQAVGKDALYNVLFGLVQGYREGKQNYLHNTEIQNLSKMNSNEVQGWIKTNVDAIENGDPVSPVFKEFLTEIQNDPIVKETTDAREKVIEEINQAPKPKLKYLGEGVYRNVASEKRTETPPETVETENSTTTPPVSEKPVDGVDNTKPPVDDVERNVKSIEDADIQVGEDVFTYGGSVAKVLEINDGMATVQTDKGKTIKIGVGALSRKPIDEATLQAERDLRRMIDGTEDLELWDNVRVQGDEVEHNEKVHGSDIQFVANVKRVLKGLVGERIMNFAELVATKPVARDFARERGIKFTGRQLEGDKTTWNDQIVDMYKVFRSGLVENTILTGVDADGRVVGTMALSANHPLYTGYDFRDVARLVESGAKTVFLGHNHPSGDPTPSDKDLKTHVAVKQFMRMTYPDAEVAGSYVLNHKNYAWISDLTSDPRNAQFEIVPLKKNFVDLRNAKGMNVFNGYYREKYIDHTRKLLGKHDGVTIVTYDAKGEIREFLVEPVKMTYEQDATYPENEMRINEILDKVQARAGKTGGGQFTILTDNIAIIADLVGMNSVGETPTGLTEIIKIKSDGTYETIDTKVEGTRKPTAVFFEDMPYSMDDFIRESNLDLADNTVFEKFYNKITDDTMLGRMIRGRKKISDTMAWNNIMIDAERYTTKYPILRPMYQAIDKVLVRNMQYDYHYGREEVWNNGRDLKLKGKLNQLGMEEAEQTQFLANLEEWHKINRALQEAGNPLMSTEEFLERFVQTEQQHKVAMKILAVKEHGIKMMKHTDVYVLTYKQTTNPLLEDYNSKRALLNDKGKADTLNKAMKEMAKILEDNQMSHFMDLVIEEGGLKRPQDILNALWNIPNVKAVMIQQLIKEKYAEHERQWYFPTTRMEGDYFIKATNKMGKPHFSTYRKLSEVRKAIEEMTADGYSFDNYDPSKDITAQRENFEIRKLLLKDAYIPSDITVPEIQQLAVKSGLDLNDPTIKKMLETLNARGFKRHMIQKQYVEGFKWTEQDASNAIESYIWGLSVHKNRTIGRAIYEQEYAKAHEKGATEEQLKYMQSFLEQFDDHTKDYGQAIRRATSTWWLAGKVSYYLQQVLQPLNTTLPYIMKSEFGGVKNLQHFTKGFSSDLLLYEWYRMHKFISAEGKVDPKIREKLEKVLTPEGLQILDDLKLEGVMSANTIKDILGVQSRIEHQYKGIVGKSADNLMSLISTPSVIVEAMPRTGSALTLLRIGRQMGLQGDNLKNFIATGIARVMGKAAPKMGVPNVVNRFGSTMRTVLRYPFVFRQFSAMNTALYGHLMDGKKGIWKVLNPAMIAKLGIGFVTRGVRYAPFVGSAIGMASIAANLYQWISNKFGDGSGEDNDIDVDQIVFNMEKYLNEEFGDGTGTAVVRGALTAVSGVDVSKIFQESTVLPTETMEYERGVTETLGGAPVAFISQMWSAFEHEDWKRVLPVAITNVIRALPPEVIQRIVETDWIPMTFKKSLVQGNIGISGITLKGNTLALPEELNSTIGGMNSTDFARLMKLMGFTTLEISRIYENAKYLQDRNESYLDNLDTIEEENKTLEKQYQVEPNKIITRTKQKIGAELNKNINAYTFYTFGQYLDGLVEDLKQSQDPMVLAYADKLKTPEYRKMIFRKGKIKPQRRLLIEERITKEQYNDTRKRINKILEEIK